MKSNILFIVVLIFSVSLLKSFAHENPNSSLANAAVVIKTIQDVKHKKPKSDWFVTKPLTQLETRDQLRTGERSAAVVRFLDGSSLRVRENTVITIFADKKDRGLIKNTKIDIGTMRFDVEKQEEGDVFMITSPTAVATIRGTSGLVKVLEDGSTLLTVESGLVNVRALFGVQQTGDVEAGNTFFVTRQGNVSINPSTNEERKESRNALRTQEKYIRVQTPQGTFRIYYLDFEQ